MKIFVKAKPNSKINEFKKVEFPQLALEGIGERKQEYYIAKVKEPPIDYRSNTAIVKQIAEYFDVPFEVIRLVSGATSKNKIFEIPD
jgi:uncharacterized protein YggU (UPF0235/DUF167 family)